MGVPISNVTRRVVYAASGTGPYNFTFEILAAGDIAVYRDDTLLTLTTNYTVTINSNGTGFVTLTATPTGATQIAIVGNRTISRTTDFVTGGDFFANTLNDELDQQTIFNQQNAEGLQRALIAPQTDPTTIDMTLPRAVDRANKTLAFDANGDPTLGISAADVANAVTYATNAANSATAAASSASAASSSALSASSSASTATTQASNASTSATNAANSASAASTSATNAASSASTAATQASNASTSATNAASSASAASTSASNAATSATNASNSASSASTSATNASNSATAAANSATSAAASASAAANTFDSFDDRYLGTKASNPTLDNDGNALVAGALYFSTSENIMKVYDGASWIAATSAGNVSFLRFRYVATSGQTTFSGADSNAATLTYTVNNIVVFLNGVSLDQTEYTATSGTSVVLGAGAALNDELVIVAFKSFVTADMVPASTGGTYAGAVRFAAGSASVPSISVSGDTNTGIFYPAADTIAFTEGGAEVARFDSAGNFGLGTSSPSTYGNGLVVYNAGTGVVRSVGGSITAYMFASSGGGLAAAGTETNHPFALYTGNSERMRIDTSGNVGIGTSSPNARLSLGTNVGTVGQPNQLVLYDDATLANRIGFGISSGLLNIVAGTSTSIAFYTNGANERARITSGGYFKASNTGTYNVAAGTFHELRSDSSDFTLVVDCTRASGTQTSVLLAQNVNANTATYLYSGRNGSATDVFRVAANGNVTNTNNSYGIISDIKVKENIVDATPKLEKLMQVRVVNYNLKGDLGYETNKQIGVIAQELEQVFPSLVENNPDYDEDGNDLGTITKSVKMSVFVPMLIKAIQEQQAMIDEMKAEIAALKGNA